MPSKRINNIIEYMTYEIYLYIQRGLFERHKLIFALMLTNKILASAGKVKVCLLPESRCACFKWRTANPCLVLKCKPT
jgi:hypothetical protein